MYVDITLCFDTVIQKSAVCNTSKTGKIRACIFSAENMSLYFFSLSSTKHHYAYERYIAFNSTFYQIDICI